MKRRELLKRIGTAARSRGLTLEQVREGANHSILRVGDYEFPVPRHSEINEYTAQAITTDLADQR